MELPVGAWRGTFKREWGRVLLMEHLSGVINSMTEVCTDHQVNLESCPKCALALAISRKAIGDIPVRRLLQLRQGLLTCINLRAQHGLPLQANRVQAMLEAALVLGLTEVAQDVVTALTDAGIVPPRVGDDASSTSTAPSGDQLEADEAGDGADGDGDEAGGSMPPPSSVA